MIRGLLCDSREEWIQRQKTISINSPFHYSVKTNTTHIHQFHTNCANYMYASIDDVWLTFDIDMKYTHKLNALNLMQREGFLSIEYEHATWLHSTIWLLQQSNELIPLLLLLMTLLAAFLHKSHLVGTVNLKWNLQNGSRNSQKHHQKFPCGNHLP